MSHDQGSTYGHGLLGRRVDIFGSPRYLHRCQSTIQGFIEHLDGMTWLDLDVFSVDGLILLPNRRMNNILQVLFYALNTLTSSNR